MIELLTLSELTNLRQVSRGISKVVRQYIPYITLWLHEGADTEWVQQWYEATHQLRTVGSVHINAVGAISPEVFALVMQLLSQRPDVKDLHLLGCSSCSTPTLQPLRFVLPQLRSLVTRDISVDDLLQDLEQLAAAAAATSSREGWQLQSLICDVVDKGLAGVGTPEHPQWLRLCNEVVILATVFPRLKNLDLQHGYNNIAFFGPFADHLGAATTAALAQTRSGLPYHRGYDLKACAKQLADIAVIAAIATAVMRLSNLKVMRIGQMPDVWEHQARTPQLSAAVQHVLSSAALLEVAFLLATVRKDPTSKRCPAARAMSTALSTLDDFGCWLLQQHPTLEELYIGCGQKSLWQKQSTWSWKRPYDGGNVILNSKATHLQPTETVPEVLELQLGWAMHTSHDPIDFPDDGQNNEGSDSVTSLASDFFRLHRYSHRSATFFFSSVTKCALRLFHHEVDSSLASILKDMTALKILQVGCPNIMSSAINVQHRLFKRKYCEQQSAVLH